MIVPTSVEEELREFARWIPRPDMEHAAFLERLVINEFLSADEHQARLTKALERTLRFAATHVPYYRGVFHQRALAPEEIRGPEDLPGLPVLTRADVIERAEDLQTKYLPAGEGPPVEYQSTGTTGQRVKVMMSRTSSRMFTFMWHRQARWFRLDPMGRFAKIRIPSTLPRLPDGSTMSRDMAMRRDRWSYLGSLFETGPELTFCNSNPIEKQIEWLKNFRPDYLLGYPGTIEELAMACENASPVHGLKCLLGIGSTATPSMRSWIERTYGVPLEQNYGLNEVGMVAIRCAAGRYHVNAGHCLVEIVDGEGRPCPPGTRGHVLVTALQNLAMPLIRYDTGDIAMVVESDCPCGRTLPSFGEIAGRYRRYAGLPEGTRKRVNVLQEAIKAMPPEVVRNLRRYQVYQDADDRFEVRINTAGPMPAEFEGRLRECWAKVCGNPPRPLAIVEGATILNSPGGKRMDFDSALYAKEDEAARRSASLK